MALLTINGTALPNPDGYSVVRSDLDSENTTRNANGYMLRDRIRGGVYKITATWTVSRAAYRSIADALSPSKFTVVFFDPNSAGNKTAVMYAGDQSGDLVAYIDENRPQDCVWTLSCSLVEY